jgi:ferredoxin
MNQRIHPELKEDIQHFNPEEWNECFHCGQCTANCSLSRDGALFPRRAIRQMQMGMKESLAGNIDPWLCYYCGDCTESCPRDANPAALMMTLRKYLTTVYDWTGISRLIHRYKSLEIIAIILLALMVLILYLKFATFPGDNPQSFIGNDGGVLINRIADAKGVHIADWIMAGFLAILLFTNIINMWYKVIWKDKTLHVPLTAYFTSIYDLFVHFVTQKRFKECDNLNQYWLLHLFLMLSYVVLFAMIVFFLEWFQTDTVHPIWHPQRLLGYIATIGLIGGVIYFLYRRIKKTGIQSQYSDFTDWLFLLLLLLTSLSGILLHFFRIWGMPVAVYITYLVHLMILVPMLMIEVPFSKWSHLAYRPFAIYFEKLRKAAVVVKKPKYSKTALAA